MANLRGSERAQYVQRMFGQIAPRYDLMNRLMTFGLDVRWRREVIRRAQLSPGGTLLDLGTGTGDLARDAQQAAPGSRVVAADFTLPMMRVGQGRFEDTQQPLWTGADALQLPFLDERFDAVVSGFLLRNVPDVRQALREQWRVLKPGGRVVTLDTSPPPDNLLAPALGFHLHTIIPTLGKLISGQEEAYTYLPDSTEGFLAPEKLAARLLEAGFTDVGFQRLNFGTIAIHWGRK